VLQQVTAAWSDDMLEDDVQAYGMTFKRGFMLDMLIRHEAHHRGQMTVLMRQAGLPVPGPYGPSREEWASSGWRRIRERWHAVRPGQRTALTARAPLRLGARAARLLHVAAQGLDRRPRRRATKARRAGGNPSHGACCSSTPSASSRAARTSCCSAGSGAYEPRWLDELLAEGALFEYWAHEASLLPIEDYGLLRHRMLEPERHGLEVPRRLGRRQPP
jgi:hypothetical protein